MRSKGGATVSIVFHWFPIVVVASLYLWQKMITKMRVLVTSIPGLNARYRYESGRYGTFVNDTSDRL
jgi:hypothetical protein